MTSRAALFALALVLLSCLGGESDRGGETAGPRVEERESSDATGDLASAPFDLSAVVRQVESAFRGDGPAHVARGDAHEIRTSEGISAFVAVHCDEAACLEGSLEFETAAISRGTQSFRSDVVRERVGVRGELVIDRGGVEERLVNAPGGVEQSWRFPHPPAGGGDLLVEVSVEGQEFAGATAGGLHFVDRDTGVGMRYGHATWIDASGERHELLAHWDGANIELRVPAEVIESSPFPAVLDPVISPEFGIDAPARGPATRSQSLPAVAFNGTHYLVVWRDLRAGDIDIYAARLDANGTVVDHGAFPVATGFRLQWEPAVASDGSQFLVVWSERRNGEYQIRGTRIDDDGTVVDTTSLQLVPAAGEQQRGPALVFDGVNYLVVWEQEGAAGDKLVATRIGPGATVLDPTGITVATSTAAISNVALAFNGTQHLMTWTEYDGTDYDVLAARVAADGSVVDASPLSIAANSYTDFVSGVASDGTDFLVVWSDDPSSTASFDLRGARVRADGTIVDAGGFTISAEANGQVRAGASFDGTNYLVTWEDTRGADRDIYAARVATDGTVLDPGGIAICDVTRIQNSPDVLFAGSRHLIVWTDDRAGSTDIYAARVETNGTVVDPDGYLVTTGPRSSQTPSVAYDGTNYLVVWGHSVSVDGDIYAARVGPTGAVLDPAGIAVSTESTDEREASVAFDGANYLVVWTDDRQGNDDIYARMLTPAGSLVGTDPIVVSSATGSQYSPQLDFDGTNYLVVWQDQRNLNADIFGARVDTAGVVLDPAGVAISSTAEAERSPRLRYGGGQYLVVWVEAPGTDLNVIGTRVDTGLNVLDPTGLQIAAGPEREQQPAVGYDQTQFLVVWSDIRNGTYDLFGGRVAAGGTLLDPNGFAITAEPGSEMNAEMEFFGGEYLVAWENGTPSGVDIRGVRLDRNGVLLGGSDFAIADGDAYESSPALVTSATGQQLVAYTSYRVGGGDGAQLRMRIVAPNIQGSAPTADSQTVVVDEDQSVAITLTGMDPDGFPVTFYLTSSVTQGSLSGTPPDLVYTPAPDYSGADLFHFLASDGVQDSAVATVTIDVQPVNDAPNVDSVAPTDAVEDTEYAYQASAADIEGDALTWAVGSTDDCGGAIGANGAYTFTPMGPVPPAACRVGIEVCDDGTPVECVEQTSVVAIAAVNDGPSFVDPSPVDGAMLEVEVGGVLNVQLVGEDPEGDSLTYGAGPLPGGAQLDAETGAIGWTPAAADLGEHTIDVSVSDGEASDTRTLRLVVIPQGSNPDPDAGGTPDGDVGVTPDADAGGDAGTGSPDAGAGALDAGDFGGGDAAIDGATEGEGCNCSNLGAKPDFSALIALLGLVGFRLRTRYFRRSK